jgi:hypothetical protein
MWAKLKNIKPLAPDYTRLRRKTKPQNNVFAIFFNILQFPDGNELDKQALIDKKRLPDLYHQTAFWSLAFY